MANTLQEFLILLHLVTLVCCITTADKKEDAEDSVDNKDDLDVQESGWIFDPLQDKARKLENLKDKIFYPFTALKSPSSSFGGGFPFSGVGHSYYPGYAGKFPTYSFGGSGGYYHSPKPKQFTYYNPVYSPYKKLYPSPPYKTWYNKNYYSTGGYQINTATYAPDCYYQSSGPTVQTTTSSPSYSSGVPLNYYYSSMTPSQSYGAPGFSFGAKTSFSVAPTPTPISYSSHFQPATVSQGPPSSYVWRMWSSPQSSYDGSTISGSSPPFPSVPSFPPTSASPLPGLPSSPSTIPSTPSVPTTPSSFPSTPSTPTISTTPSGPSSLPSSVPSGPSSFPIPLLYNQDEGIAKEVIITPPPQNLNGYSVTSLPGPKLALPESSYQYSPPTYAVAYYPNVFYITNEQRSEKTTSTQSVAGAQAPGDGTSEDSSETSVPSSDTQPSTDETTPSTKSQSSVQTLPGPGFATFYSTQTLDQTKVPLPYNYNSGQVVVPQPPAGFYASQIPTDYGGSQGVALQPSGPAVPLTNTISTFSYPLPLAYNYGQSPSGYQITRTSKSC